MDNTTTSKLTTNILMPNILVLLMFSYLWAISSSLIEDKTSDNMLLSFFRTLLADQR